MGKYSKYQRPTFEKPKGQHPVWRGIGFLLIILIPIIAFASAMLLVDMGMKNAWPIPRGLLGYVHFPEWVWKAPVLPFLARPIASFPNLWAVLIAFISMLVLISGVFTTVYAIIRRIIGPSRFSAVDAPPARYTPKSYKR